MFLLIPQAAYLSVFIGSFLLLSHVSYCGSQIIYPRVACGLWVFETTVLCLVNQRCLVSECDELKGSSAYLPVTDYYLSHCYSIAWDRL